MLRETPARFIVKHKLSLFVFFLFGLPASNVTAQISRDLAGHIGGVVRLAFSPDSSQLVTVGYDGRAKIWDGAFSHNILQFCARVPARGAEIGPRLGK